MVRHAKHFSLPYGVRRLPPGPPPHILIHCPSHSDRNRFTKLSGEPGDRGEVSAGEANGPKMQESLSLTIYRRCVLGRVAIRLTVKTVAKLIRRSETDSSYVA